MMIKIKYRHWIVISLTVFFLTNIPVLNKSSSSVHNSTASSKNVILMIGDGMGYEQVKLARWVEVGKTGSLFMEQLPHQFSIDTNNLAGFLTDSAAGATAFATGARTANYRISNCWDGSPLKTILEIAQDLGMSTGIVTTTRITHATPAAFASHENTRNYDFSIANQLVESGVDVFLGGGKSSLNSIMILNAGYSIVQTKSDLATATGKVWGMFDNSHMQYEFVRSSTKPSIKEMTEKAIELLSSNPNGFFLMVEGGRIDHAGHAHNSLNAVVDTIAFDKAVKSASDFAINESQTLVLVTADHETGGLSILSDTLSNPLPTSGNTEAQNNTARSDRLLQINIDWTADYHTAQNVPLFAYGSLSSEYSNNSLLLNTDVFQIMKTHLDSNNNIPVSSCGSTSPYWASDANVGDKTQFRFIPSSFVSNYVWGNVAINNSLQEIIVGSSDIFTYEIVSVNNTLFEWILTIETSDRTLKYRSDPQPTSKNLVIPIQNYAYPHKEPYYYATDLYAPKRPSPMISTNLTLLGSYFANDPILSYEVNSNDMIVLTAPPTSFELDNQYKAIYDKKTGLLIRVELLNEYTLEGLGIQLNTTTTSENSTQSETTTPPETTTQSEITTPSQKSTTTFSTVKTSRFNYSDFLVYIIILSSVELFYRKKSKKK